MDRFMMQIVVLLLAVLVVAPFVQNSLLKLNALLEPPPTAAEICTRNPEWTLHDCQRITSRKIWLGMTDSMARASLGDAWVIHRCRGEWGVYEEWVYESGYLYFENGVLARWDESAAQ
ncbi:hypothetical protein ACFLSF_04370 [Candidatus Bipolaricaulota bacterium]